MPLKRNLLFVLFALLTSSAASCFADDLGVNFAANFGAMHNALKHLKSPIVQLLQKPEYAKELNLTKKQVALFEKTMNEALTPKRLLARAGIEDLEAFGEMEQEKAAKIFSKMADDCTRVRKESTQAVLSLLSDQQRLRLMQMQLQEAMIRNRSALPRIDYLEKISTEELGAILSAMQKRDQEIRKQYEAIRFREYSEAVAIAIGKDRAKELIGKPFFSKSTELQSNPRRSR